MRTDDIVRQRFAKVFRGYDVQEVDLFLDDVIREMERLELERNALLVKLEALLKELERCDKLLHEYRQKEKDEQLAAQAPKLFDASAQDGAKTGLAEQEPRQAKPQTLSAGDLNTFTHDPDNGQAEDSPSQAAADTHSLAISIDSADRAPVSHEGPADASEGGEQTVQAAQQPLLADEPDTPMALIDTAGAAQHTDALSMGVEKAETDEA